jgi:phosphoglycolate phosphatase-like HAD superfamily hydrolase
MIPTSGRHGVLFDVDGTLVDIPPAWAARLDARERGLQPAGNGRT